MIDREKSWLHVKNGLIQSIPWNAGPVALLFSRFLILTSDENAESKIKLLLPQQRASNIAMLTVI